MKKALMIIFLLSAASALFGETVFVDDFSEDAVSGRFVIEAENYSSRTAGANANWWQVNGLDKKFTEGLFAGQPAPTAPNNARGNFMEAKGSLLGGDPTSLVYDGPCADYKIEIENQGIYNLFIRWNGRNDASDSLYTYLLNSEGMPLTGAGPNFFTFHQYYSGDWKWDNRGVQNSTYVSGVGYPHYARWNITTPGIYTIRIAMRENEVAVDTILFQTSNISAPSSSYSIPQSNIYDDDKVLTNIDIMGPNQLPENSEQQYKAIASYDDGSEKDITGECEWFADNCNFAGIEPNGLFYCDMALYINQTCNIYAEYTTDANEVLAAEKEIAILPMCPAGSALTFDGVDDYVDLGSSEILKPELPVSISCWLNISKMEHAMGVVLLGYTNNRYTGIWMDVFLDKKIQISFGNGGSQGVSGRRTFRASKVLEEKKWYYVNAIIYDATNMDVYIDGIKYEGEYSGSGSNLVYSNGESRLGFGLVNNLEYYFNGQIDEVAIFNRALTAEEVQYNMCHKLAGNEAGLVGYWDLDEGAGRIAHDKSANGNDGEIVSDPYSDPHDPCFAEPNWVSPGAPAICTRPALVKRNLATAIDMKEEATAILDDALIVEKASLKMLQDIQRAKAFDEYKVPQLMRARVLTMQAIIKELWSKSKIASSISDLINALDVLDGQSNIKANEKEETASQLKNVKIIKK